MKNYMEKGIICKMTMCKALVQIPRMKKEMRMILKSVMRRFEHRKLLNYMKREISKLMGVGMTMQNMVMV
jgi:hypothetical protein